MSSNQHWRPPVPKKDIRMSSQSSRFSGISQSSVHDAEIGEAVTVPMRSDTQRTLQYREGSRKSLENTDEESLYSEGQVGVGRLNTITNRKSTGAAPEMVVNTEVSDVVPPRLRRRPVSEIITPSEVSNRQTTPTHRFSMSITDDLERLMESANSLKSDSSYNIRAQTHEKALTDLTSADNRYSSDSEDKPHAQSTKFTHTPSMTMMSTDTFETADSYPLPKVPEHKVKPDLVQKLPKRPSPQNMEKARQASQQYSLRSQSEYSNDDKSVSDEGDRTVNLLENVPNDEQVPAAEILSKTTAGPHSADFMRNFESPKRSEADDSKPPTDEAKQVKKEDEAGNYAAFSLELNPDDGEEASMKQEDKNEIPIKQENKNDAPEPSIPGPETTRKGNTEEKDDLTKPQAGSLLAKSDPDMAQRATIYNEGALQDGDFYDIEEPVVIENPVRVKSVRQNTQIPKRKSTKKKHRKSARSSGAQLKPFSYNTLIHLLESINGTVIGEEFDTLNLPIKEKQMIEKIIDLLSRLTSDMVLDENRYEIGLQRLEKAHRVLEGFL